MSKGKSKGKGYRPLKNAHLITKQDEKPKIMKDANGNPEWTKSVGKKSPPSKTVLPPSPKAKVEKVAPVQALPKPDKALPLKSTTNLTPPAKAIKQVQQTQVPPEKRASNLLKEAQAAKAAAAKKPPVKSPPARGK